MTNTDRLATALADRYRIDRKLGAGGIALAAVVEGLARDRPASRREPGSRSAVVILIARAALLVGVLLGLAIP